MLFSLRLNLSALLRKQFLLALPRFGFPRLGVAFLFRAFVNLTLLLRLTLLFGPQFSLAQPLGLNLRAPVDFSALLSGELLLLNLLRGGLGSRTHRRERRGGQREEHRDRQQVMPGNKCLPLVSLSQNSGTKPRPARRHHLPFIIRSTFTN